MKKFICNLIFGICLISFVGCSKDDEFNGIIDDNSSCYIDYFMNKYYDEYYYNNDVILDKRDVKNFEIRKFEKDNKHCILLTINYYEKNNHGYISSILNTLDTQIINEFNSDDIFYTPGNCIQILCKHSHCLDKYKKYNTN